MRSIVLMGLGFFLFAQLVPLYDGARAGQKGHPQYPVPPPPFSEGIFPCSQCHEGMEVNKQRRPLSFHENIKLKHLGGNRWCLDCHDAKNRDKLRLANGELISFKESYVLCGQCHGPIYRDWKLGIHGKRTGYWNGPKRYLLCVHCHSPHQPRFKPLKPMPPPKSPYEIRLKSDPGSDRRPDEARHDEGLSGGKR